MATAQLAGWLIPPDPELTSSFAPDNPKLTFDLRHGSVVGTPFTTWNCLPLRHPGHLCSGALCGELADLLTFATALTTNHVTLIVSVREPLVDRDRMKFYYIWRHCYYVRHHIFLEINKKTCYKIITTALYKDYFTLKWKSSWHWDITLLQGDCRDMSDVLWRHNSTYTITDNGVTIDIITGIPQGQSNQFLISVPRLRKPTSFVRTILSILITIYWINIQNQSFI